MRHKPLILGLAWWGVSVVASGKGLADRSGSPCGSCPERGYDVVRADNDIVSIKVYPQLGGRLMFFGQIGGPNQLQTYPERWNIEELQRLSPPLPGQPNPMLHYGGLRDVDADPWRSGRPFWICQYEAERTENGITVETTLEGVCIRREMTLVPGRSELLISTTAENVAGGDLYLHVWGNPSLAVGGSPGPEDLFVFTGKSGITKRHYVTGGDEKGIYFDLSAGWAAIVDTVNADALVFRFDGDDYVTGFFWLGEVADYENVPLAPVFEMDPRCAYYTFDVPGPTVRAGPGETLARRIRWQLLTGIADIDGVGEDVVIDLATAFGCARKGESLPCTVSVASAGELGQLEGRLQLSAGRMLTFPIPPLLPGRARQISLALPIDEPDGQHELIASVCQSGETIASARVPLKVASVALDGLEKRIAEVSAIVEAAESGLRDSVSGRARLALAKHCLKQARAEFGRRTLDSVDEHLNKACGALRD